MRSWAAASALLVASCAAAAADRLPAFQADATRFTVSGISSGGYMAVQLHVAHSSRVSGVAALAAGPYYCARGSLWTALGECMTGAPAASPADAERFAREKAIDPTSNLAAARVWLFSGRQDRTVVPAVVEALGRFYAGFQAKPVLIKDTAAGHAMVTADAGNACGDTAPPFINDCDYDAAGEALQHLLGKLAPPAKEGGGRIVAFDQREFNAGHSISMDDTGYAYVPRDCERERCRVHVAFHGCRQGAATLGERFVREAGYNRWAESNRLIVLYPQAVARWWWIYNPRGCWDWWGYTGSKYATKEAPQIRAVMAMVQRLSESRR